MEPIDFLRQYPPFDQLSAAESAQVQARLEVVRYPRGATILRQGGSPSAYLYLIQQGTVSMRSDGATYQVLEEGEAFGYPSLLSGAPPTADVIAASDVTVCQLPADLFRALLDNVVVAEYFLKSLVERLRRNSAVTPLPERSLITPLKFLSNRRPIFVEPTATVQQAAQIMVQEGISSVLVRCDPSGILTDRDLRGRVLAVGLGPTTLVQQVMTCPLKTLDSDTPVYAALHYMLEENIHHLALVEEGEVVGLVTNTDLLRHQAKSPLYLHSQLAGVQQVTDLADYNRDITATVEALAQGGVRAAQIGTIIASLNDTLLRRLLRLAEAELGPPPTPYGWLVFGSEGRSEQLLLTDQDNALVYAEASPAAATYFAALAQWVVNGLISAGFPPCPGGYMATNWCKPLAEWEAIFQRWVRTPDPKALMEAAIFFDFRKAYGALPVESLEEILTTAHKDGVFIGHMVRAAQEFAPPLGFFGRIRSDDGFVDLKKGGIAPIVGLARACALAAGSRERSTLERLVIAANLGTISQEGAETLAETFQFLMGLRLQAQLTAIRAGFQPDNRIHVQTLTPLERRNLKEAFVTIRQMQEGVGANFHTGLMR